MAQPSPLSVLSGALKIANKSHGHDEAVGNEIRLNSQGWEDGRSSAIARSRLWWRTRGSSISWPSTGRRS